jgi:methyltransferase
VVTYAAYLGLLALLGVERLVELRLSKRNAQLAFARGGREVGQAHYRVMTALHTAFLVCAVLEPWLLHRSPPGLLSWVALTVAVVAQALRYWAIGTLGERWNTRVIVVPDAPPVTGGPYRFMRHPNYLAVVLELAAVPLIAGAWLTALSFSLANAALLFWRIRVEEAALGPQWQAAFADHARFLPKGRS